MIKLVPDPLGICFEEPLIRSSDEESGISEVTLVISNSIAENNAAAFVGDYVCWEPKKKAGVIKIFHLQEQKTRKFYFGYLFNHKNMDSIKIDACDPKQLIKVGMVRDLDSDAVQRL